MKIDEIPDLKSGKYPEKICVSLTTETKTKLDILKKEKRKDISGLVRMLIDDFLENIDEAEFDVPA